MTQNAAAAVLMSWEFSPLVVVGLLLASAIYFRGWLILRRRGASRYTVGHLAGFHCGLAAIYVALQSPLDVFAAFSLQIHMLQHLLLMIVAPPLILSSAPTLPCLAGMPSWLLEWLGPFARWRPVKAFTHRIVHPVLSWPVFVVVLWLWHAPFMYELALENPFWHRCEHASLLFASMLFWWTVVHPYPRDTAQQGWLMVPHLFLAGVQGTVLAGLITFSDHVLYANYATVPNPWGLTDVEDQQLAGALMWVPMSLAFLIGLVWIIGRQMSNPQFAYAVPRDGRAFAAIASPDEAFLPVETLARSSDVRRTGPLHAERRHRTRESVFGKVFRQRLVRRTLQLGMVFLAMIVIVDGLLGPQVSAVNLAGVAPWIHWRGLLVISLLVGGNFFCMVCPFTAFRPLARKWFSPVRHWPGRLRNKWLAIGVLIAFFWAYECFSLWDRPAATAAIIVGFFCVAFVFDALFVDAPFCKFVCPIGQFNFVYSLVSPSEVSVASTTTCTSCTTKDCIVGNERSAGCQLSLFLPQKVGNMDCTCCLDCADACPHDNVILSTAAPGFDLTGDKRRSGVGRYPERLDLAALFVVLLFASLVNAAWMTAPVVRWETQCAHALGIDRWGVVTLGTLVGLCVVPLVATAFVARWSESAADRPLGWLANLKRFAPALVPLAFGMWLAHYSYHLFTSGDAIRVAASRFLNEWIGGSSSMAVVSSNCCDAGMVHWLLPLELLFLDFGLCLSLYIVYRIARVEVLGGAWIRMAAPWLVFIIVFFMCCVWVLLQPMQMRGVSMVGM